MAKKVLYLGNGKWCWTETCKVHASTIMHKNNYLQALETQDGTAITKATQDLISTSSGEHTYRFLKVQELTKKLGRRPNLGLDLDGTTGNFTDGLRTYMGTSLKIEKQLWLKKFPDPVKYAMWTGEGAWYTSRQDFIDHFSKAETEGIYRQIPIFDFASETLNDLKAYGFNIKAITARNASFNEDTRSWIQTHRIPARYILNYGMQKERAKNIDLYIDDAPEVISRLIEHQKKIVIMHQEYNSDLGHEDHTRRTNGWGPELVNAVFELLDERKKRS